MKFGSRIIIAILSAHIQVNGLSHDQFMPRVGGGQELEESAWASSMAALESSFSDVKHLRASVATEWKSSSSQPAAQPNATKLNQTKAEPDHAPDGAKGKKGGNQMYFRPVSVTLQCVMCLTIVSLLVYTALAFSRNKDELSATFRPSTITQTLTVASRTAQFAPMMCMLFVGCRMYVLATTEGLGEPPQWVKNCMWLSVTGMGLQLSVVVLLPIFTKKAAEEEASYDMTEGHAAEVAEKKAAADKKYAEEKVEKDKKIAAYAAAKAAGEVFEEEEQEEEIEPECLHVALGEQNDAHPKLSEVKFDDGKDFMKAPFWILQVLSMVCLYGGLGGVIYGIVTFPAQSTKMSVAVMCTVALSALYFTVCALLWVGRSVLTALEYPALAMSSVIRKAPMFAVLFLASRMRALQLDPPYGMPPFWMQCCFYGITACVFLETIVAAVIGATGTLKKAYYGVYIFAGKSNALNALQHSLAIASFCFLFPVVHGVYAMKFADGSEAPLSTTLKCVVVFTGVYFSIMLGQSMALFAEEVKGREYPICRDAFVAAGISMGLAPLLCILFVATRMRALQITQQQGAPPGWAQDCMLIAVFACCVQCLCCLLMPIFIGDATKVDEDGNPDYDLEPMIGAYAVTVVKYVALMALHGSVITVCVAVYVMTPETAHSGDRFITSTRALFKGLAWTMGIFCVALLFSSAKVVGMAFKLAIESPAVTALLGVEITVDKVALNLFKGFVQVKNLKVLAPEEEIKWAKVDGKMTATPTGKKLVTFKEEEENGKRVIESMVWHDDYIAKVHLLLLKINLFRLLKSALGRIEFELENLSLVGVHVNVEKPNTDIKDPNSNIEYIINKLDSLGLIPPEEELTAEQKKAAADQAAKDLKDIQEALLKNGFPMIVVHKIALSDLKVCVTIKGVRGLGQIHFEPSVGGIEFPDVQRDVFGGREDLSPGQTVACLISAISKQIFHQVKTEIPKQITKAATAAAMASAHAVGSAVGSVAGGVAHGVGSVGKGIGGLVRKLTGSFSHHADSSPAASPKAGDRGTPTPSGSFAEPSFKEA